MTSAPEEVAETLHVSPPTLARFLSREDRDRSVVLLDVETFCPSGSPTFLFNVILNSVKVRRGTATRADFHFATMGVEISVLPKGARIVDYTQSAKLSITYQRDIASKVNELEKAGGALSLSAGSGKGEVSGSLENETEKVTRDSASFVSTENELVATFRTVDLLWRLDPINAERVLRQFQQGNLWLTCSLEAAYPYWSVEISIRPTEFRAYGPNLREPLSEIRTIWMLMTMWAEGVTIRNRDGETIVLSRKVNS